jgi:hypothetical protein
VLAWLACLAIAATRASAAGNDTAARQAIWQGRNSPAAQDAASRDFLGMLTLDGYDFGTLSRRPLLAQVAQQYKDKQYVPAVATFVRYYAAKLRNPAQYGLVWADVSPYARGIAGFGMWPVAPLSPDAKPQDVIASADRLMQGVIVLGGKDVAIGEPGQVNWLLPYASRAEIPVDGSPYQDLTSARCFYPLVQAYLVTRRGEYLQRWADYLDDWALNCHFVDDIHPLLVPDSPGAGSLLDFVRLLGGLASALPPGQELLPPATFARVMRKLLLEGLLQVAYIRSNTHNWTPYPGVGMLTAFYCDEFKAAPCFFREARRRSIESFISTQMLRDGGENQQDLWYLSDAFNITDAFRLLDARLKMPDWQELPWLKDIRNSSDWRERILRAVDARANFLIHMRTPQDEWPIIARGGPQTSAGPLSYADLAPRASMELENVRIRAAIEHPAEGLRPTYTDEWFPYTGFDIIREGWDPDSGYGILFCSPQPGAYGAYRSRSNNNSFGLNAFGQDLLIDDSIGHYMYPTSPITVDGQQQFFHAGIYKVPPPAGHKVFQVSAWTQPAPWRWLSSPRFSLMEGVYSGPYGNLGTKPRVSGPYGLDDSLQGTMPLADTLRGITHQRLVFYARRERLWIVADRMLSIGTHAYTQYWRLPIKPTTTFAFQDSDIHVDASHHRIFTDATDTTSVKGKPHKQANISMWQFSPSTLDYATRIRPKDPTNHYMPCGWKTVQVSWKGVGNQLLITAIFPRRPGRGTEGDLRDVQTLTGPDGMTGFSAVTPSGQRVSYAESPDPQGALRLGDISIHGEALLWDGESGIVLGCKAFSIRGSQVTAPAADFEFGVRDGKLTDIRPIYRPIDPVQIEPDRNVFTESVQVTLSSRTPGVAIHYTLDGTDPTPASPRYAGPFPLTTSAIVTARAYRPGVTENPVETSGTYATVASRAVFTREQPVESVTVRNPKPGLSYQYFEGDWKQLWLTRDELTPAANGVALRLFDLSVVPVSNPPLGVAAAPRQHCFAIEYTGYLNIPQDGAYTFHAPREYVWPDMDAGYELQIYVGNNVQPYGWRTTVAGLNEWYPATTLHAIGNWSIALQKGLQPFKLVYIDYRTDAPRMLNRPGLHDYIWAGVTPDLRVSGPGVESEPIPAAWLMHQATGRFAPLPP